jgi:hypothetical protein
MREIIAYLGENIMQSPDSKISIIGEVPSFGIDERWPGAGKFGQRLLLLKNIGNALDGIEEFGIPGNLRKSCEFER